ncbi:G-type lectin S-receptor-like serine/threonine-protein kinase At1g11410 [Ziziphus jujuba]|uniref:G-type lectin S-receptor-like serine/threonine-protein kinase At1g11410 n=1 Tax=Ziziphus jujuba TaxID=326968 RepID=A0ABM3ZYF6_ZIZJJ|nr:G-type lectin S-receptor-like serine/threonine-protein kinase At1g11410 [Ziziphus jujuba]
MKRTFKTSRLKSGLFHLVLEGVFNEVLHHKSDCFKQGVGFNKQRLCTCLDTISIESHPIREGDVLVSSEENFALGFFNRSNNYRYVGIWHRNIPGQTVVWSTNAPSSACSPVSDCVAQLLDSGNLVLLHNISKQVIWQLFDHPTNTMLPSMKFGIDRRTGANRFLTSWKSEDDPRTGNYSFRMDPSVCFCTKLRFHGGGNGISDVWGVFNSSILSRIVVNESGMVQLFIWYEGDERRWNEMWSAPTDRCDPYGDCSSFGLCDTSSPVQFECSFLPGYEPRSPTEWYMRDANHGCVRKPGSLICREGEGFVKVANVKVPDTSRVDVINSGLILKACEKECWRNCNCTAYASADVSEGGSGCILWHGNLTDTRKFIADGGQDLYIRVDEHELGTFF